jgi:hypothetical protein
MATKWSEASTEVISIAQQIIKKYHDDLAKASIGFLFREDAQVSGDKLVLGKASKVPDRLKPFLDYDFLIWLSQEDYVKFDNKQREALIDHELCHCTMNEEDMPKMRHHDIEEFGCIVERYGLWKSDLITFAHSMTQAPEVQLSLQLLEAKKEGRIEAVKAEFLERTGVELNV